MVTSMTTTTRRLRPTTDSAVPDRGPRTITLTAGTWGGVVDRLDRVITDAARAYLQGLRHRDIPIDPLAWARELDRLTQGRPLDYGRPGLPLMYAVRYMPRRVISLMGALSIATSGRPLVSLVDVGSGTGATIVAIQLLYASLEPPLTGVDASQEMVEFARRTQDARRHQAAFVEGTIESLINDPAPIASSDLVTFSAPFDRTFNQWAPLAAALDTTETQSVLAVEPESRAFLLYQFEAAFRRHGWQTRRSGSRDIPAFMKAERPLPGLTRFWRQIGAPGAYQPQTWWEPPADEYLIASRS